MSWSVPELATPSPTPPTAPYKLSAEAVSQSMVKLQWMDNSDNEDGFRVYRGNNLVATVGTNVTSYQDTALDPATTYQYAVKAYNQVGESGDSICTVRTLNPPITVRLDRIGVYDNGEYWLRGEAGEVYVGIIVTDGNNIVERRFPAGEGQLYKLCVNEIVDIGAIIFCVDEVGDHLRIAAIGYEADGGLGETLIYQALGAVAEAYISGGAASLLEMTDLSLGNILAKLFGAEDDWLGSYENVWDSDNNWGIGSYTDIACAEEDGTLGLRLWFTIENPMEPLVPTETPMSSLSPQQFDLVTAEGIQVACPREWEDHGSPEVFVYCVCQSDTTLIYVTVARLAPTEAYFNKMVASGSLNCTTVGSYMAYKGENTSLVYGKQVKVKQFIIVKGSKMCTICFSCDVDKLGVYESIFEYIPNSFKFL